MNKGKSFRTPTRSSPQKMKLSQIQSRTLSQKGGSLNNSMYASKSLTFAHSSLKMSCSQQSHSNQPIHSICLKEDCDKPVRFACAKCLQGHHRDHLQNMIKVSDFLHFENKEAMAFETPNWPQNPVGKEIRDYIDSEQSYIQDVYDNIEVQFDKFIEKIKSEVLKIKQSMQADVANYYKKGEGKRKIDFINQLKSQYVNSYDLTDLQTTIKDTLNRGLNSDIIDSKIEYFINSQQYTDSRQQVNNFYQRNKLEGQFKLDLSHLQDLQKQVTDGILRFRKLSNVNERQTLPKTQQEGSELKWNVVIEELLHYLFRQYQNLSPRDIIQYKQEIYADGSKFEGFLVNGHRDIVGSRFYADGNIYLGEWSKGVKQGNGVFHYYKGNIYEGEFHNDKREGYGKEIFSNGNKFEGYFSNDMKEGQGKYTYYDGKYFVGTYKNDKRDSQGVIHYPTGKQEQVIYKEGVIQVPNQDQTQQQSIDPNDLGMMAPTNVNI